eukprot:2720211-Karenia_brevis.AAC.1
MQLLMRRSLAHMRCAASSVGIATAGHAFPALLYMFSISSDHLKNDDDDGDDDGDEDDDDNDDDDDDCYGDGDVACPKHDQRMASEGLFATGMMM